MSQELCGSLKSDTDDYYIDYGVKLTSNKNNERMKMNQVSFCIFAMHAPGESYLEVLLKRPLVTFASHS